jgi:Cellulose biosynthesis protein BcsS
MSFGRRVCATVIAAAACSLCCLGMVGRASAGEADEPRVMLLSGRDASLYAGFAYAGIMFAPGGFENDGVLLKALFSGGLYSYNASNRGGEQVVGLEEYGSVLPGWRIKRGNAEFKFFFGPEYQRHRFWPDDPTNHLRGNSLGLRMAAELWHEPTPDTMIVADVSLSSVAVNNSARAGYGWRVFEETLGGLYVGPETQYFRSDGYRQWRLGAHITSMKTEDVEWSAATGWAMDSQGRASPYLRLNVLKRL